MHSLSVFSVFSVFYAQTFISRFLRVALLFNFLLAVLFSQSLQAGQKPAARIAVLWVSGDAKGALRSRVSQKVRAALQKSIRASAFLEGKAGVGKRKGIARLLKKEKLCRPSQQGCAQEVAQALDANLFIIGTVFCEKKCNLTLTLHQTHNALRLARIVSEAVSLEELEGEVISLTDEFRPDLISWLKTNENAHKKSSGRVVAQKHNENTAYWARKTPAKKRKQGLYKRIAFAKRVTFEPNITVSYPIHYIGSLSVERDELIFKSDKDTFLKHDYSVKLWRIIEANSNPFAPAILIREENVNIIRRFNFSLLNGDEKDQFLGKLKVAILKSKKQHSIKD